MCSNSKFPLNPVSIPLRSDFNVALNNIVDEVVKVSIPLRSDFNTRVEILTAVSALVSIPLRSDFNEDMNVNA